MKDTTRQGILDLLLREIQAELEYEDGDIDDTDYQDEMIAIYKDFVSTNVEGMDKLIAYDQLNSLLRAYDAIE